MPDVRKMYDKAFVYAYDLEGKPRTVTIKRVTAGEIKGTAGKASKKPVVYFADKTTPDGVSKKGLALCITNARVIAGLYGGFESDLWIDKKITLYPTTTEFGGKTVDCIRIKNKIPTEKAEAIREDVPLPEPVGTDSDDDHEATV